MTLFSRLFLLVLAVACLKAEAFARAPESQAEKTLLYWRYLCREQPQEEVVQSEIRSLKCPSQGWIVRTPASTGQVKEIVENEAL